MIFYDDDNGSGNAAQTLQAATLYLLNTDTGNYAPVTITQNPPSLTLDSCVALGAIPAGSIIRTVLNLYDVATGLYCPITASGSDTFPTTSFGVSAPFNLTGLFYTFIKLFDTAIPAYVTWQCFNATNYFP
jgi:hypothetical protein